MGDALYLNAIAQVLVLPVAAAGKSPVCLAASAGAAAVSLLVVFAGAFGGQR